MLKTLSECMLDMYTDTESYMHKSAKETLRKWFEEIEDMGDYCHVPFTTDWADLEGYEQGELSWRGNRGNGGFLEYPIVVDDKVNTVINNVDEMIIPHGKEMADGISPTYEQCKQEGHLPRRIIDLVIPHKGSPAYFIEVCHKHPVSEAKLKDLTECGVDCILEIDASWIMSQVKRPKVLKFKRILFPGWDEKGNKIGPKDCHITNLITEKIRRGWDEAWNSFYKSEITV